MKTRDRERAERRGRLRGGRAYVENHTDKELAENARRAILARWRATRERRIRERLAALRQDAA